MLIGNVNSALVFQNYVLMSFELSSMGLLPGLVIDCCFHASTHVSGNCMEMICVFFPL